MGPSLQRVIGARALAEFDAPASLARGLPAAAYTSEAFFPLENERIFARSWVFAHELARPGETLPVTMAGRPILLVCDTPGEVRAFHSVCRHRCLKLVDEPGNVGRAIAALTIPGPTASTMRFAPLPISAVAIRVRHPPASTARSTGWCRCARRSGTTGYS